MYIPEFCAFLCNENYCDDILCESCPIEKLMLEGTNFLIKETNKPMDDKKKVSK